MYWIKVQMHNSNYHFKIYVLCFEVKRTEKKKKKKIWESLPHHVNQDFNPYVSNLPSNLEVGRHKICLKYNKKTQLKYIYIKKKEIWKGWKGKGGEDWTGGRGQGGNTDPSTPTVTPHIHNPPTLILFFFSKTFSRFAFLG